MLNKLFKFWCFIPVKYICITLVLTILKAQQKMLLCICAVTFVLFSVHQLISITKEKCFFQQNLDFCFLNLYVVFFQAVSKQLKMLSFANPGKFMEDFDPERSAREMRKMNRRIYREKWVSNPHIVYCFLIVLWLPREVTYRKLYFLKRKH